jgi:hypothetical protein
MKRLVAAGALSVALARTVAGQQAPTMYPELRADAILAAGGSAQAGAGIVVPAGVYVRVALDGAAGVRWHDGTSVGDGRVDLVARFLLDPLRENNVALSVGGGLSTPIERDGVKTPLLTVVLDVEGRRRAGWTPGLELGLGGGARIGFVFRQSPARWR